MSNSLLDMVKQAKNRYSRSDNKHLKPKEGRNVYRIIVPKDPAVLGPNGEFWADLGVHWIKTSLKGKPLAVVGSRDICFGEPCDVGLAYEAAKDHVKNSGFDEDTIKLVEEMRAQKSVLFCAIERSSDAKAQNVEILEVRPSVAQQIMDLYLQYAEAGSDMFDPTNGVDIVITRTGKGLQTEYTVNVRPGVSAPITKDALSGCVNLREHIEKEFFKGDENKAIATLCQVAGINVPRLAGGSRPVAAIAGTAAAASAVKPQTQTAALSEHTEVPDASSTAVDDTTDIDTSGIADDDLDALLDDINNL